MAIRLTDISAFASEFLHSRQWPERPEQLAFEITAACDAACIHCPREDLDRPMKAMAMPLFRKLIDDAARMKVPYLCPNGYGEICTIPLPVLTEYLEYITASSHRFKLVINTNGYRMNEERAALFLKHAHVVNVTIDGATAATAESIRRKLKFDVIEENIKRLLAMRRRTGASRPKVRVGMVSMPQTQPEIPEFFRRWKGVADLVGIGAFSTRLNSVTGTWSEGAGDTSSLNRSETAACVLPFRDLNIWADGIAVTCCEDWNEAAPVGDLKIMSLSEIWNGPELAKVRAAHAAGRGADIALCASCNWWRKPTPGARLWTQP
jgi:MoaA/NifB/PqqE/SkfB family radical SAM enzyme